MGSNSDFSWDYGSEPVPRSEDAIPRVGASLGPYQLLSRLGSGGMATVFRAQEIHTGRHVALKIAKQPDRTEASRKRFQREGEITASLDHPGIVRVHSAGEAEGYLYIAYELIEGARTLEEAFAEVGLEQRLHLVLAAARALGYAHARGVIHRDVKPDNILIDASGTVKVADFGLATARQLERLTQTGAFVGTPFYMAPEQFDSSGKWSGATDVWALGILLYEALTGALPFHGDDLYKLLAKVTSGRFELPSKLVPGLAPGFEAVCLRALELEPTDRYANGEEFANDLRRALDGEPVAAFRSRARTRRLLLRAVIVMGAVAFVLTGAIAFVATAKPKVPLEPGVPATGKAPELPSSSTELLALEQQHADDPVGLVRALEAWIAEHPTDPRALELLGLARRRALSTPVWEAKVETPFGVQFVQLGTRTLLLAHTGGTLNHWEWTGREAESFRVLPVQPQNYRAWGVSDGVLVCGDTQRFVLYDLEQDTVISRIDHRLGKITSLGCGRNGDGFAAAGEANTVTIYDSEGGMLHTLRGLRSRARRLVFSPDGSRLLGLTRQSIHLWLIADGSSIMERELLASEAAAFSPDGSEFAIGDRRGNLNVFEAEHGVAGPVIPLGENVSTQGVKRPRTVEDLVYDPRAGRIYALLGLGLVVVDLAEKRSLEPVTLQGFPNAAHRRLSISHDGFLLALCWRAKEKSGVNVWLTPRPEWHGPR